MFYPKNIRLHKLIQALSRALDLTSKGITLHHSRVAFISAAIATALGLKDREERENLICSALLHDIGILTTKERVNVMSFESNTSYTHTIIGNNLLSISALLAPFAKTIKHHHDKWNGESPSKFKGEEIPLNSRIIHIADRFTILIDDNKFILGQKKNLIEQIEWQSGKSFQPMLVDCLKQLIQEEAFLLDITTDFLWDFIEGGEFTSSIHVETGELLNIANIFAEVIDLRTPYTKNHSLNVTKVAVNLAAKSGFSSDELKMMEIAGLLHDIGKLSVSNEILDKQGKLTDEEFDIMRGHTYFTYHILKMIDGFDAISEWAAFHHEKLNGEGYPFHLKDDKLPLGSRILAVSDIFSAFTEDRPYRKSLQNDEIIAAMNKMVERGDLDSRVVSLLKENIKEMREIVNKNIIIPYDAIYQKGTSKSLHVT